MVYPPPYSPVTLSPFPFCALFFIFPSLTTMEFAWNRRSGNGNFAYDQRRRYISPTPPSVQGSGPVETTASAPQLDATRQYSSLMARRDPSLMAQGHRYSSFAAGDTDRYTYHDIYRGDQRRGKYVGSEAARGSSSREGGCSTHPRSCMGGKGVEGHEK